MGLHFSEHMQNISRLCVMIINGFFIAVALTVIGVALFLLIYKGDILSVVFEMPHIRASIIIIIFCGAALLVLAVVGLSGAAVINFYILAIYVVFMLAISLLLIAAGIIGIVFKNTWYIDQVRQEMKVAIQEHYGVNITRNEYNAHITVTYDLMQSMWYCCGVEDNSWGVYRQSDWYNRQPGFPGTKEFSAMNVPESCCVKTQYGQYVRKSQCQNFQIGPPNIQSGQYNEALFYKGCFIIGREMLELVSSGVIGLGLGVGVLLYGGIIPAVILLIAQRMRKSNEPFQPPSSSRAYYVPPPQHSRTNWAATTAAGGYNGPAAEVGL